MKEAEHEIKKISETDHGYILWNKEEDKNIRNIFQNKESLTVHYEGEKLGEKSPDFSLRRMYIASPKILDIEMGCFVE